MAGKKYPENTPAAIARKIHNVRYRSKNFNFGLDGIIFILIRKYWQHKLSYSQIYFT